MNIEMFISVYFAHCSFLFCLWISTEAKRKLEIDEKQTVKVEDDGTESNCSPQSRVRGGAFAKICCPTPPGLSKLL